MRQHSVEGVESRVDMLRKHWESESWRRGGRSTCGDQWLTPRRCLMRHCMPMLCVPVSVCLSIGCRRGTTSTSSGCVHQHMQKGLISTQDLDPLMTPLNPPSASFSSSPQTPLRILTFTGAGAQGLEAPPLADPRLPRRGTRLSHAGACA